MDIEARLEYIIFENKANHYVVAGFSELKTYHNFTAAGRIEVDAVMGYPCLRYSPLFICVCLPAGTR